MIDSSSIPEVRVPFEQITAVVDSNVVLELYSIHDIARAPAASKQARVDRARDSLLLAIYLDQIGATTYSLSEAIEVTRQRVPSDTRPEEGDRFYELLFTTFFIWFVKEVVLSRWNVIAAKEGDPLRSNAADRHLEDFAHTHKKPLITNEAKLRKRARERGVDVYSPRHFWDGRLDVAKGSQRFLRRFAAESPTFARRYEDPPRRARMLPDMFEFYRYLLLDRE